MIENRIINRPKPPATFLKNIKAVTKNRSEYLFGVVYQNKYIDYDAVPIICEQEESGYLTDIITGKKYRLSTDYFNAVSSSIILKIVDEIPSRVVVNILKSLSNEDIARYQKSINNLEYAMKIGYENYENRVNAISKQNAANDDFIKQFRNKHSK